MGFWQKMFGKRGGAGAAPGDGGDAAARDDGVREAIERALVRVYGEQEPFHFGVAVDFGSGGPDPLDGISIYWNERGPHFHYVSYGMAPVMGAELTFRLAARFFDVGTEPASHLGAIAYNAPTWPIQMLNMLGRRVHRTGRPFGVGHWWQGPPGVLRPHAEFERLGFVRDPELGSVTAPSGEVLLLQAVAITQATLEAMQTDELEQRGDATLDALAADNPLYVTDPSSFRAP